MMSSLVNTTITHETLAQLITTDHIKSGVDIFIRLPNDPTKYLDVNHVYLLVGDPDIKTRLVRGTITLNSGMVITMYSNYAVINQTSYQNPLSYMTY